MPLSFPRHTTTVRPSDSCVIAGSYSTAVNDEFNVTGDNPVIISTLCKKINSIKYGLHYHKTACFSIILWNPGAGINRTGGRPDIAIWAGNTGFTQAMGFVCGQL